MNVTIIVPDELLKEIDLIVSLKKLALKAEKPDNVITDIQRHEAFKIAKESGVAAANRYLDDIQKPLLKKLKVSRMSVLIQYIEKGLKEDQASLGVNKEAGTSKPKASQAENPSSKRKF